MQDVQGSAGKETTGEDLTGGDHMLVDDSKPVLPEDGKSVSPGGTSDGSLMTSTKRIQLCVAWISMKSHLRR
jgi:hypothetical protein